MNHNVAGRLIYPSFKADNAEPAATKRPVAHVISAIHRKTGFGTPLASVPFRSARVWAILSGQMPRETVMNSQRIIGIVLLVVGVIVAIMGMNASHSMSDQVTNTFTGHFTDHTTLYIVGGIAAALIGLFMTMTGMRGGRSA